MNNPESSVRKNINIKFKDAADPHPAAVTDQHNQMPPVDQSLSNNYHYHSNNDNDDDYSSRRSSRSRSSRSRSRSSSGQSRSRSRSYDDEEDDYSSSHYSSSSPQRRSSPFKRTSQSGNNNNNNNSGQFGEKITDWNFPINFSAERIQDPTIFICDLCRLPVINYGRLLPCKHTFCYPCALKMNQEDSKQCCTKCRNAITSVELCPPGQLFVCTFGGTKLYSGCRRAYRTSEDLQTHANQRHNGSTGVPQNSESATPVEAASSILASIQVHQQPQIQSAPALQLLNSAQLPQLAFQQRPPQPQTSTFPFGNPMMAQALLFQQQQTPFLFRGGPAGLFMAAAANMPPPLVFSTAGSTQQPNPNSSQQSQNQTAGQ